MSGLHHGFWTDGLFAMDRELGRHNFEKILEIFRNWDDALPQGNVFRFLASQHLPLSNYLNELYALADAAEQRHFEIPVTTYLPDLNRFPDDDPALALEPRHVIPFQEIRPRANVEEASAAGPPAVIKSEPLPSSSRVAACMHPNLPTSFFKEEAGPSGASSGARTAPKRRGRPLKSLSARKSGRKTKTVRKPLTRSMSSATAKGYNLRPSPKVNAKYEL